jgi:hypothetical protein
METQIEALTQYNTESQLRALGQSHHEVNREEHEEEESNNHTNDLWEKDYREDNHQEDNFQKDDHCCEF